MELTTTHIKAALGRQLDQLSQFAGAHLQKDDAPALQRLLQDVARLQTSIDSITDRDIAPPAPISSLMAEALARANSAYGGAFSDPGIALDLPIGYRDDLLADLIATTIREVVRPDCPADCVSNALARAAEELQNVADAMWPLYE